MQPISHHRSACRSLLSSDLPRSLAGASKAAPAVGHGVDLFVQWSPDCPVIPLIHLYRQRQVLKIPRGASGIAGRSHPRGFPPVCALDAVECGGVTFVDLVTGLWLRCLWSYWQEQVCGVTPCAPYFESKLRLRTRCPALDESTRARLGSGWSCSFAGCRSNY